MKTIHSCTDIVILLIFNIFAITAQTITDYDGNIYSVVAIGTQVWMGENLNSTHYSDGEPITYLWKYNDSDSLADIYGRLYGWGSAMRGQAASDKIPSGVQGVCPDGWHLPSSAEWMVLIGFYGGDFEAGAKLKEAGTAHWYPPNEGATNESGFTGLPGGSYDYSNYSLMGETGFLWTTNSENDYRYFMALGKDVPYATIIGTYIAPEDINNTGYSVRCLRNPVPAGAPGMNQNEPFTVFPDPADKWIMIRLEENMEADLSIYGIQGRLMYNERIRQPETVINIESFPEGVYVVSLKNSRKSMQARFIKTSF